MNINNIHLAIEHFGSQAKLAKAAGVATMTVSQWKNRNFPPHRAKQVAALTNGALKPADLLPDFFNNI